MTDAASRLIIALDFPTVEEAESLVALLGDKAQFYKIGLELLFRGGMELAERLAGEGKKVFIDAKLLDIGNTIEKSVANISKTGAHFLTIHGHDPKSMNAAVEGRGDSKLRLLAVTVLTNLDQSDITDQGTDLSIEELVIRRAKFAHSCGIDGVVASGFEAKKIRQETGPNLTIVTPGIRLPESDKGDQTRIVTPQMAIEAGADYLVVGRPITKATSPSESAGVFVRLIDESFRIRHQILES